MKTQSFIPSYNGKPIDYSLDPYILTGKQARFIETTLTKILKEVEAFTSKAVKSKKILKQLGLPLNLDPKPTKLGLHIPFARFDFTFDPTTNELQLFELNTDGTSAWNVMEWLGEKAQIPEVENPNFELSRRLFEGLKKHQPKAKNILLVDFDDLMTSSEQTDLCQQWGISKKSPTDHDWAQYTDALIYRRAVSWTLRERKKDCAQFLKMWAQKKLQVVGGWSSDVGMSKAWPIFLQNKLFPESHFLTSEIKKMLLKEKDQWILKPMLGHSGRSLIRGIDVGGEVWKQTLQKSKNIIAQRLVELPQKNGSRVELGLFFINGKPAGYMCRSGHQGAITDTSADLMRPVQIKK